MTPLSNRDLAARQKIAERQALLSLNPDEAQAIADQTLHSSLWQVQSAVMFGRSEFPQTQ